MLYHFAVIFVFLFVGLAFPIVNVLISRLIHVKNPNPLKMMSYECGEEPTGMAWSQFNIRFYTIALAFLIFDVEVLFLFPWAVLFNPESGMPLDKGLLLIEMLIFLVILSVGFIYLWVNKDLDWAKPTPPKYDNLKPPAYFEERYQQQKKEVKKSS